MSADADEVLARRVTGIKTSVAEKRAAAAEARKKKKASVAAALAAQQHAPGQPAVRPQRVRRQTKRAEQMDVDPDPPTPDARAQLDEDDEDYEEPQGSSKRRRTGENDEDSDEEEEREARAGPNLHPEDPPNFCKLATAVKLLMARPITDAQIDQAEALLRSYLPELIHVRPCLLDHLSILTFLSALRRRCDQAKPPLRYSYPRECPRLWTLTRILDVSV
ncbi:hypothetical protein C8R47DRAFT_443928 [Mycena vitilis]|nr:hypothetical protein C8R47DRAFT_443928 [Mycena vitilis]